jgi:hypothetical protein
MGALLVTMVALGMQEPGDDYSPYGISADDAAELTGESRELWELDLAIHQTAIAGTPGPRGTSFDPPVETPVPQPTGFVSPNSTTNMGFGNAWYGESSGERVAIFAGFSKYDETTGMVLVTDGRPPWDTNSYMQLFPGTGPLLVVDVVNGIAQLSAVSSAVTYAFDIGALTMSSPTPGSGVASPTTAAAIATQTPVSSNTAAP